MLSEKDIQHRFNKMLMCKLFLSLHDEYFLKVSFPT